VICSGKSIVLTAIGGNTFEWSDGATDPSIEITPMKDTTYSVVATSGACTSTDSINISVSDGYELQVSPDTTICLDSRITLMAIADNDVQIEVQPSETSIYTVRSTDGICEINSSIEVAIDDINVSILASDETPCIGDTIVLDVNSNGNISWADGLGETSRRIIPPADTVIVIRSESDRLCQAKDSISITVNALPEISISGLDYYCTGSETTIEATSGLVTYMWNDNDTNPSKSIDDIGTYTVVGTDNNGCSNTAMISIEENTLPVPEYTGSTTFCPGSNTVLSVTQKYDMVSWDINGIILMDTFVQISENAEVILIVTDEFGCKQDSSFTISENPSLNPIIRGSEILCAGTTNILGVGEEFDSYTWSNNGEENLTTVTQGGAYSVTVTTDDGCSGRDTIIVREVANPTVEIIGRSAYCRGDSTELSVAPFPIVNWSNGDTESLITVNQPGPISIQVEDDNGCVANDVITITENSLPDVNIIGDTIFCLGDSVRHEVIGNFVTPIWHNGSTLSAQYITQTQTSSVEVEDENGCKNSTSIFVEEKTPPTPQIIAPESICDNATINIYSLSQHSSYN